MDRRTVAAFVLVAVVLAALLWFSDPGAVLAAFGRADGRLVVLAALSVVGAIFCKSVAISVFLASAGESPPRARGFLAYCAAMFGKQVLPMGRTASVLFVTYTYAREVSLAYDRVLGSVTVSEGVNSIIGLSLALVGLAWIVVDQPDLRLPWELAATLGAVAVLAGTLVAILWIVRRHLVEAIVGVVGVVRGAIGRVRPGFANRLDPDGVRRWLTTYVGTLRTVAGDGRAVTAGSFFLLLSWLGFIGALSLVGLAIDRPLSIGLVTFAVPAGSLVLFSPLPGGLGTYEVGVSALLVAVGGLPLAEATAVTLLYRLCSYWLVVVLGGASLAYSSATLSDLADGGVPPGELD